MNSWQSTYPEPVTEVSHHVRLNRFADMDPVRLRESLELFKEGQLPRLERESGFRTLFFGADLERGMAAGISFWRSEPELRASERAEASVREQALERAGGSLGRGLVDRYRIIFEHRHGFSPPARYARLARWEGVRPSRMTDAFARFEAEELPVLEGMAGFSGLFVGTNALLGNTLSVSLWTSRAALEHSLDWERGARQAMESGAGLVPRTVIADSYAVAIEPQLRSLRPWPAWTEEPAVRARASVSV